MKNFKEVLRRIYGDASPEARIADALQELQNAFFYAEAAGRQFTHEAKLARSALKAIYWL